MAEEPKKPNVVPHGKAPGAPRQVPNNFSGDYIRTDGSMGNAARDDERHKKEIDEELKRNAALRKQNAGENPPVEQASQELKDATAEEIKNPTSPLRDNMNIDNYLKQPGTKKRVEEHRLFDSATTVKTLADKNHDGNITGNEIDAMDIATRTKLFEALDMIKDNSVTADEINAVKRKLGGLGVTMEINADQLATKLNMGIFGMLLPVGQQPAAPAAANQPNDRGFSLDDFKNHQNLSADKQEQMKRFLDSNGNGTLEAGEFLSSANRALIDRGVTETSERNAIINSLATTFTPSKIPALPPNAPTNKNR